MRLALHWQILIAIVLALITGMVAHQLPDVASAYLLSTFEFIGAMFMNALKMLIVPLVMSSIIVGVANIGGGDDIGRLGARTIAFYVMTTLAAVVVGLVLVDAVRPGIVDGEPAKELLALQADTAVVEDAVGGRGASDIIEIFVRMIPPNIVQAAADGQMLGIIFFAVLFGFFMTRVGHEHAEPLFRFWDGVFQVMMRITDLVMRFAPIGVFGLIGAVIAKLDFSEVSQFLLVLATYAAVVAVALIVHLVLVLPAFVRVFGGVRPYGLFPAMAPALLTAFSTSSSSATLPITMDCIEENAGVSRKIASFVLPLGATVNMNGTALYECVSAIFLAQAYGLELTFTTQFIIVVTALVTSIGVAGVPSASLIAIAIILKTIGLPLEAIGVLFVFDRLLDMARTAVNVFGDACCTLIVARREGEETALGAA